MTGPGTTTHANAATIPIRWVPRRRRVYLHIRASTPFAASSLNPTCLLIILELYSSGVLESVSCTRSSGCDAHQGRVDETNCKNHERVCIIRGGETLIIACRVLASALNQQLDNL